MRRQAYTLIELLVALAFLAIIAGLGTVITLGVYRAIDRHQAAHGAIVVQQELKYQRVKAMSNQGHEIQWLGYGLRFQVEKSPLGLICRKMSRIYKPDDYTGGTLVFTNQVEATLVGGDINEVEAGDYIRDLFGAGQARYIRSVDLVNSKITLLSSPFNYPITPPVTTTSYMVGRGPRSLGDQVIAIPYVVIDVSTTLKYQNNEFLVPPIVANPSEPNDVYFDILFNQHGSVSTPERGSYVLWIRREDSPTEFDENPTLLVVNLFTGSVNAYEPGTPADPYGNVK